MDGAVATESKSLTIQAPFDGLVMTSSPENLIGKNVGQGEELLSVAKVSPLAIRIFVPAPELNRVHAGDLAALNTKATFREVRLRLSTLDGEAFMLPEGIVPTQEYKGIEMPTFYAARIQLDGAVADLRPGMVGRALIFDRRRSVADRIYESARDLVRSYFW
jgi:hypothetical protein